MRQTVEGSGIDGDEFGDDEGLFGRRAVHAKTQDVALFVGGAPGGDDAVGGPLGEGADEKAGHLAALMVVMGGGQGVGFGGGMVMQPGGGAWIMAFKDVVEDALEAVGGDASGVKGAVGAGEADGELVEGHKESATPFLHRSSNTLSPVIVNNIELVDSASARYI